ncbi:MAG: MBL fold metallo-hydrolase [bacterium]|nr:MBL fold metallo-hydrolase [bacterium]
MRVIRLVVGSISTNCYIVESNGEAMVIDPGGDPERIFDSLEGMKVSRIGLTHGHPDHIGGLGQLKSLTEAPVYVHKNDLPEMSLMHVGGIVDLGVELPGADEYGQDGNSFDIGDVTFTVLHTPGHTRGGVCLYTEGLLFTGDTLFAGSIGRTDLGGGDYDMLIASIRNKILTLPDDTRVLPGHGPESTIEMERASNPFLKEQ